MLHVPYICSSVFIHHQQRHLPGKSRYLLFHIIRVYSPTLKEKEASLFFKLWSPLWGFPSNRQMLPNVCYTVSYIYIYVIIVFCWWLLNVKNTPNKAHVFSTFLSVPFISGQFEVWESFERQWRLSATSIESVHHRFFLRIAQHDATSAGGWFCRRILRN